MSSQHNITSAISKRLFVTKLLHWSIIFYWASVFLAILLFVFQLFISLLNISLLIKLLPMIIFLISGAAFSFSLLNAICTFLLRRSKKHTLYIVMWIIITKISFLVLLLTLFQAIVVQGKA